MTELPDNIKAAYIIEMQAAFERELTALLDHIHKNAVAEMGMLYRTEMPFDAISDALTLYREGCISINAAITVMACQEETI